MKEKFNSLNEIHAIKNNWEKQVVGDGQRDAQGCFLRMIEEVEELREALQDYDGSFEKGYKAGLELADVFITGLSVADSLGFDIERLIFEKLNEVFRKYNPHKAQELKNQGLTWQEVVALMKKEWNDKQIK